MFKQKDYEVTVTPRYAEGSTVNFLTMRRPHETESGTGYTDSVIDFEKAWATKLVEFLKECGMSDVSYDETKGYLKFWGFYLIVAVRVTSGYPKSGSVFLPVIILPRSGVRLSNSVGSSYPAAVSGKTTYSSWSTACIHETGHVEGQPYDLKFGFRFIGEPTKAFALYLRGYLYRSYTTSSGSHGHSVTSDYDRASYGMSGFSRGYNILSGNKVFYCVSCDSTSRLYALTFTGESPTLDESFSNSAALCTLTTSQEVIDANPGVLPLVNRHNETYRWEDGIFYYPKGFGVPKAVATSNDYAVFLRINGKKYWVESGDGILGLVGAGVVECPTED